MRKLILLLVLLAVAALINPDLRARAEPYARPYLEKGLAPVYEYSARMRVKDIARRLQEARATGEGMPSEAEFSSFLERQYRGPDAVHDPWGTPYFLRGSDIQYRVVSAGRDRIPDTEDDLTSPWVARN